MATPPKSGDSAALQEPRKRFERDRHPEAEHALKILEAAANVNELTGTLMFPGATPYAHRALTACLEQAETQTRDHGLPVVSFDIDLTLATGEQDEEGLLLIDPAEISRLQALGYIVGSCSDREPSDQRGLMETLGQSPNFAIPKELLAWARRLLPGAMHLHVGDDPQRDEAVAMAAGWRYQTPGDYTRRAAEPEELRPGEQNNRHS